MSLQQPLASPLDEADQTVVGHCADCQKPLSFRVEAKALWMFKLERWLNGIVRCNDCADKRESTRKAKLEAARALARTTAVNDRWNNLCPVEFRKTLDWSKQGADKSRFAAVMRWTFGERGLFLYGRTRRCKTRFAWALLHREHEIGKRIVADTHAAWRMTLSRLAATDAAQSHGFLSVCQKADILFIDDLGKGRGTPAAEEAFFMVLDARVRSGLPTIFTSNDSYAELQSRFSQEYGEPIVARIAEYCDRIDFGGKSG